MKNLLLLLVLANILYFLWGWFVDEPPQPGVAMVDEAELGPALEVTADRSAEAVASIGAVLGSGEPSDLEAVVGRSCVTIGPFRASEDADTAQTLYSGEGMRARPCRTRCGRCRDSEPSAVSMREASPPVKTTTGS